MRFLVSFVIVAAMALAASGRPAEEKYPPVEEAQFNALLAVDGEGHDAAGAREVRQFGYGGFGGHHGGFGGHHGGFGGHGGHHGGFGGGHHGGFGGHHGGYGFYG